MSKKWTVIKALLGTSAIVIGGCMLYKYVKAHKEIEVEEDEDLKQLGRIEYDEEGYLKFCSYIKIFQIASSYAKVQIKKDRKDFIKKRREAFANDDMKQYESIVSQMTTQEEEIINCKLMELIAKIGIEEHVFQQNTMFHSQDENKVTAMMKVQKQGLEEQQYLVLPRQLVFKTFQTHQDIQIELMDIMMTEDVLNLDSSQDQMQVMMRAWVQQSLAQDRLFDKTGVEDEQLLYSIEKLELDDDPEFKRLVQKNVNKAKQHAMKAQERLYSEQGEYINNRQN